jgi:hypothetical protein
VDSDFITKLLERNLVTRVIATPMYIFAVSYMLREEASEQIEEVVECLLKAGLKAEAGSLLLQAKRLPASLSTFSMAIGSLGHLFRLKY